MMTIKISSDRPGFDYLRQTPGSKGVWDDCQFIVNRECPECDWWVICEGVKTKEHTKVPKDHTILITAEPPGLKQYQPGFLNQFGVVITAHQDLRHPNVINAQQALPWWVGVRMRGVEMLSYSKGYDELKAMDATTFKKEKCLSVISSNVAYMEGHRRRTEFAKALKSHFGDRINSFGRGLQDIEDKWDAISPYKYHIAIENTSCPHYWTEKLSDAFLGCAYPFYYGCPNLEEYFPKGAFTRIEIRDVEGSIDTIEKAIESRVYEKTVADINRCRELVLDKYNLFPMLAELCNNRGAGERPIGKVVRPEASFGRLKMWTGRQMGRG
jgi:hypothetical protein